MLSLDSHKMVRNMSKKKPAMGEENIHQGSSPSLAVSDGLARDKNSTQRNVEFNRTTD